MIKLVSLSVAASLVCGSALAAPPRHPPLPPPRPDFEAPPVPEKAPPAPASDEARKPAEPKVCAAIADGRLFGADLPPSSAGDCGMSSPVRIDGVKLSSGARLKLTPDAVMDCAMAEQLGAFLDEQVARMQRDGQGKVVEVQQAGAYECRGQNRVVGAKLSEHALGNAIDLRVFKFANGRKLTIGVDKGSVWTDLKTAACKRFKTVLGPGSDAEHSNHLHLDMRARKSSTICQWTLD